MTIRDSPVRLVTSGRECSVGRLLGEGGEGAVYETTLAGDDARYALKWYHPEQATEARRQALTTLVDIGPPDDRFLWPIEIAYQPGSSDFGYLMLLRPGRFHGLGEFLGRRVDAEFRELAIAGLQLAHCFLQLHSKGLCYRDISYANMFFDPETGDVLVCDNDNVGIDGEETFILGTPYFMAPEIVRREAMPSANTDRFSLAVLLFYMFMLDHPLLGEADSEEPVLLEVFGTRPTFIFDPDDPSNRPVEGVHRNALFFWPIFPSSIRSLFTRAFSRGLRDPNGRVRESEWRRILGRLHDAIVPCKACGAQNFYDPGREGPWLCYNPECRRPIAVPPRLLVAGHEIALAAGTRLYAHHVSGRLYDFEVSCARVVEHHTYDLIGLTNTSDAVWSVTSPDGRAAKVRPSETVRTVDGLVIDFGTVEGRISA
ncbi:MAG: serine/threonine protein kinase [Actinomycetota bacterium]|nr:serine/threonine protein kinase [Actinomycetota bacterium]